MKRTLVLIGMIVNLTSVIVHAETLEFRKNEIAALKATIVPLSERYRPYDLGRYACLISVELLLKDNMAYVGTYFSESNEGCRKNRRYIEKLNLEIGKTWNEITPSKEVEEQEGEEETRRTPWGTIVRYSKKTTRYTQPQSCATNEILLALETHEDGSMNHVSTTLLSAPCPR